MKHIKKPIPIDWLSSFPALAKIMWNHLLEPLRSTIDLSKWTWWKNPHKANETMQFLFEMLSNRTDQFLDAPCAKHSLHLSLALFKCRMNWQIEVSKSLCWMFILYQLHIYEVLHIKATLYLTTRKGWQWNCVKGDILIPILTEDVVFTLWPHGAEKGFFSTDLVQLRTKRWPFHQRMARLALHWWFHQTDE